MKPRRYILDMIIPRGQDMCLKWTHRLMLLHFGERIMASVQVFLEVWFALILICQLPGMTLR